MKKEIIEWARALIGAFVLTAIIIFFIRPTVVYGPSMEPSYYDREYLLISKAYVYAKGLEKGDVVIFKTHLPIEDGSGEKNLIKRIIGVAGDTVEILDGKVYINGSLIEETYTDGSLTETFGTTKWVVGEDEIFVLGDNRDNSKDSRFEDVGLVNKKTIMGKVILRVLPLSRAGTVD